MNIAQVCALKANIKATYQLATLIDKQEGVTWYPRANAICQEVADQTGLPLLQVIAVTAALSPANRWERNVKDMKNLIHAFVAGGAEEAKEVRCSCYGAMKEKAIKILEADDPDRQECSRLLNGPKIQEFFNSILDSSDVCIDGHAYCIAFGERMTLKEVPSIGVKMRRLIKDAYAEASYDLGLMPSALQAITWVTWRKMHGIDPVAKVDEVAPNMV